MHSPAAERNKQPILDELKIRLPNEGHILELACGSMQHAQHFATHFSKLRWQPTDVDANALAHGQVLAGTPENLQKPIYLDVTETPWPIEEVDAVYSANLLHISVRETLPALFKGASLALNPTGQIYIYGPFKINNQHTAESNAQFDANLRSRNPAWGIYDVGDVAAQGNAYDFNLAEQVSMPVNNHLLVFERNP